MKIILLIAVLVVLLVIALFIVRSFTNKGTSEDSNVKIGFFHPNGNLDFYLSKDNHFISRIDNKRIPIETITSVKSKVDEQVVYQKTKEHTDLNQNGIDILFEKNVKHITYEFKLKNGEQFEAVVDVASNSSKKQRSELKQSLLKLNNLLNEIELT